MNETEADFFLSVPLEPTHQNMYKNAELFVFHISSLPGSSVQRVGEEPCFQNHQDSDGDQHRLLALRVSGKYPAVQNGLRFMIATLLLAELVHAFLLLKCFTK